MSKRSRKDRSRRASGVREFNPDYSDNIQDLKRIAALAGFFILLLIVLSFFFG